MKAIVFKSSLLSVIAILIEIWLCVLFGGAVYLKLSNFESWLYKFANISSIYEWNLAWLSYVIVVAEILVSAGLLIEKFKTYALTLSMVLLGIYSLFLLYQLYSPYGNSCSCQGIFPFLDLPSHLILTVVSLFLTIFYQFRNRIYSF